MRYPADICELRNALLASPQVGLWLDRLVPHTELHHLHSSQPTAYENAMGKLTQLGCQNGMQPFDDRTQPFRDLLVQTANELRSATRKWTPFRRMIVGTFLTVAGYHHDDAVQTYMRHRLNTLYQFTKKNDYALYVDRDTPDKPLVYKKGNEKPKKALPLRYLLNRVHKSCV